MAGKTIVPIMVVSPLGAYCGVESSLRKVGNVGELYESGPLGKSYLEAGEMHLTSDLTVGFMKLGPFEYGLVCIFVQHGRGCHSSEFPGPNDHCRPTSYQKPRNTPSRQ